ncbi:MAG: LacI family DNA-binding transcriptional regulator [Chloroflexota bacterium]
MVEHDNNKIITQEDVARHAGVTRSIVSYVINNGPRKVSEETRIRVLAAIKELGYRPNKHAQMLSSTDDSLAGKYIGIILAGNYMLKRPYYGSILASIHEHAHERDWRIRFIRVFDDFNNPTLFNELIHPNEISGAILIGLDQVLRTADHNAMMEAIVERVERVVCVEWEWPGVPSIQFDLQNAAYRACNHLLTTGRHHVAYIGPEDRRMSGYQQALWEHKLTLDNRVIFSAANPQAGYECCEAIIRTGLTFDGICVGTDETAIGVMKCLHEHHLAVPKDVGVASIDNIDISMFVVPALTTIDVPKHQIGVHAVDILVSGPPTKGSPAFAINVPIQLIIRESSVYQPPSLQNAKFQD